MAATAVDFFLFKSLLLKHDGGLHSLRMRSCVGAKELGEAHKGLTHEEKSKTLCV